MSTTRFSVGAKRFFVEINYTSGGPRMGNIYLPWMDKLNKINVVLLECQEHHRVRNTHASADEEPSCDGFIFGMVKSNVDTFPQDMRWLNQYPTASYGQISTNADYYVMPEAAGREEFVQHYVENFSLHFEEASIFLERIERGISELTQSIGKDERAAGWVEALKTFREQVIKALNEVHPCVALTDARKRRDGSEIPGWHRVTISLVGDTPSAPVKPALKLRSMLGEKIPESMCDPKAALVNNFHIGPALKAFERVQLEMLRADMPEVPMESINIVGIPQTKDNRLFYSGIAVAYSKKNGDMTDVSYAVMMFPESAAFLLPANRHPLDAWDYTYAQEVERVLLPHVSGIPEGERGVARLRVNFHGRGAVLVPEMDYDNHEQVQEFLHEFTERLILETMNAAA